MSIVGAVETGGTKFRAAVFDDTMTKLDEIRVPTTTPDETLDAVSTFLQGHAISALGIASFGPLVVDRSSPAYGSLASTPKPGWSDAPILSRLQDATGVPADIQTDVEAAAIAEAIQGAGVGHRRVAYVTVGTGIGVGVSVDGSPYRGVDHTEMGHIPVERHANDAFSGRCPFHAACLEGMACGPAIEDRWGAPAEELGDRAEVWALEADYLAQLACVLVYSFSPDRILFSGGVGARPGFADMISARTHERLNGYSVSNSSNTALVATAALANEAGLTGAALLGRTLLAGTH